MNIIDRLKKLKALADDKRASTEERNNALAKYMDLKEKYNVELDEEETSFYSILCKDEYMKTVLYSIIKSFKLECYILKKKSKRRICFECSKNLYELILDEYKFHEKKVEQILTGTLVKYCHSQIYFPQEECESSSEEPSREFMKAYLGNSWLNKENFSNTKKIS